MGTGEKWFIGGGAAFIAGSVALIIWLIYQQALYNRTHHCRPMGPTYTETLWIPISDGKNTTLVPQFITHELYQCDNGQIWE